MPHPVAQPSPSPRSLPTPAIANPAIQTAARARRSDGRATSSSRYDDDLVRRYLDEIGRYPLLTRADEQDLGRRMELGIEASRRLSELERSDQQDDELQADGCGAAESDADEFDVAELQRAVHDGHEARRTFLLANLRLVVAIATREQRVLGMPLLDLVQEGNVGLMHAVERFDWRRGFKFSTYATYWIREAMQRGSTGAMAIRVPRHQFEARARLRHAVSDAELRPTETGATHDQLAARTQIPVHDVRRLLPLLSPIRSLDEPVGGEADISLGDVVADRCSSPPEEAALAAVERTTLHRALANLTPLEREIVTRRFGLDEPPQSLPAVARDLDMTPERAQTVLRRALRRLGRAPQIVALRPERRPGAEDRDPTAAVVTGIGARLDEAAVGARAVGSAGVAAAIAG